MAFLATSADLIGRAYQWLREPSASPQYWPSATVVDHLDEAQTYLLTAFNLNRSVVWLTTSAGTGFYPLPADVAVVRHVLYQPSAGLKFAALQRTSQRAFLGGGADFFASGTATHWAMAGQSDAASQLQLYPAPDTSAGSALYVLYNSISPSIAASATVLPTYLIHLIPLETGLRLWQERGNAEEVQRLSAEWVRQFKLYERFIVDVSPDDTDPQTFQYPEDSYPYDTRGVGVLRGFDPLSIGF